MRTEVRGDGDPDLAVVAGIHGDEQSGIAAVERFMAAYDDADVREPVKLVIANEEAAAQDVRYIDTDLNRCFPGDPDSDRHEERLAAQLLAELGDCTVLDLHSTRSRDEPFGVVTAVTPETVSLAHDTGVDEVVNMKAVSDGSLLHHQPGVVVECGTQGSDQAADQAYEVLLNVLAANNVIDHDAVVLSDPVVYRATKTVPKQTGARFTGTNFTAVRQGEPYATVDGEPVVAEETFYPVLMSTDGYDDILGFAAERRGRLSALAEQPDRTYKQQA